MNLRPLMWLPIAACCLALLPACQQRAAAVDAATASPRANAAETPVPAAATTAPTITDPPGSHRCTQRDNISITRDRFEVVMDGDCGDIVVTGSSGSLNTVRAQRIRVEGNHVTVLNDAVQALEVTGADNTFNMTQVTDASIEGDRNTLVGGHYGRVRLTGNGNTLNIEKSETIANKGRENRVN